MKKSLILVAMLAAMVLQVSAAGAVELQVTSDTVMAEDGSPCGCGEECKCKCKDANSAACQCGEECKCTEACKCDCADKEACKCGKDCGCGGSK